MMGDTKCPPGGRKYPASWLTGRRGTRCWLLGGRAGSYGAGWVGDPVRPGADVEGGREAGRGEGEDLVGCRHARAAVGGHRAIAGRAEGGEPGRQVGLRL